MKLDRETAARRGAGDRDRDEAGCWSPRRWACLNTRVVKKQKVNVKMQAVANHWVGRGRYLAVLGRGQLASQGVHTLVHPDHLVLCLFPPSND